MILFLQELILENNAIIKLIQILVVDIPIFHKLNIYGSKKTFENHANYEKNFSEKEIRIF